MMRTLVLALVAASLALFLWSPAQPQAAPPPDPAPTNAPGAIGAEADSPERASASARAPLGLYFEENRGQAQASVAFLARQPGVTAFFSTRAFALRLVPNGVGSASSGEAFPDERILGADLSFEWVGARDRAVLFPVEELPGKVHYLKGSDPSEWRTHLRTFGRIVQQGLYPGVQVEYHGRQGRLEYDLVLDPEADLGAVAVRCEGALSLEIDAEGSLVAWTEAGPLVQPAPETWEEDLEGVRRPVPARFVLLDERTFGFAVERSDPLAKLVIDPLLCYSSIEGGSIGDWVNGIDVDTDECAYTTGVSQSPDFPVTPGAFDTTVRPNDCFVAKLAPAGDAMVYATFYGGTDDESGQDIEVNGQGEAFVVGITASDDLPLGPCPLQSMSGGGEDAFAFRLSANGAALIYSTYLGGSQDDRGLGIAINGDRAHLTGSTASADFPLTPCAPDTTVVGLDAFAVKLVPSGQSLDYATFLGGDQDDIGWGVDVSFADEAFYAGVTSSSDFPVTPGAFRSTVVGSEAFITRLTSDGASLVGSTLYGGSGDDEAREISLSGGASPSIVGSTTSTDLDTTPNAIDGSYNGNRDAFAASFHSDLTGQDYGSYLGGSGDDIAHGLDVDPLGVLYVAGETTSSDLPATLDAFQLNHGGGSDAWYAQIREDGSLTYLSYLGFAANDIALGIALDFVSGKALVGGLTRGSFPTSVGAFEENYQGGLADGFVSCFINGPCDITAQAIDLGGGCGPLLAGTNPIQGQAMTLSISGAMPNSPGIFNMGFQIIPPVTLQGVCDLHIDPGIGLIKLKSFNTDANGDASFQLLIPNDVVRCGQETIFQATVVGFGGALSFGEMTNALRVILGS